MAYGLIRSIQLWPLNQRSCNIQTSRDHLHISHNALWLRVTIQDAYLRWDSVVKCHVTELMVQILAPIPGPGTPCTVDLSCWFSNFENTPFCLCFCKVFRWKIPLFCNFLVSKKYPFFFLKHGRYFILPKWVKTQTYFMCTVLKFFIPLTATIYRATISVAQLVTMGLWSFTWKLVCTNGCNNN